jgi:predicted ester cyclase
MSTSVDASAAKALVRRLVEEVMNEGRVDVLPEIYTDRLATAARKWIEPFLASFADVEMRIVEIVAEGDRIVGRFTCSGTHVGPWLGHPATGRRFHDVPEVYFFTIRDGRIAAAWGLEDTFDRLRQLGILHNDTESS